MYPSNLSDPEFLQRSENYWFYGIVLSCVCYGLNFALSLSCIGLLSPQLRYPLAKKGSPLDAVDSKSERRKFHSLAFVFILLGLATVSIIPIIIVGKGAFNETMNSSGGPAQYLVEHAFQNVTTLRVAYVASMLCHIFINIHRIRTCLIIQKYAVGVFCQKGAIWHRVAMSMSFALFFASIVSGTMFLAQVLAPSHLPHYLVSQDWVLIWGATATALSWELISMISISLLIFRRLLLQSLGRHRQLKYTGMITMLVESVVLLSSFSIFFMVSYSLQSPSLVMVPFLLSQMQVTSPLVMLYRITSSRLLSKDPTFAEPSMPTFAHHSTVSEDTTELEHE